MKKKYLKYNYEMNSLKIVPKEYIGYILLVGVFCACLIPGSILSLVRFIHRCRELHFVEGLEIMVLPLCGLSMITYVLISIIKICKGKIYLEVSNEFLIYNGVLFKKNMSINNIKTIRKVSGYYKLPLTHIIISRRTDKHLNESKRIRFPLIWFEDRDVDNLLVLIGNMNRKIKWSGFYMLD